MPIYVVECTKCSHTEERLVLSIKRQSEATVNGCEVCGEPMKRQPTSAAIQLLGDGWARDGYKGSKKS